MAKTLSESAAEILKASMNAGKEQMNVLPDEVNDLGGATHDNPGGTVNEPPTAEAPKPGQSNTESPEKKIGSVKSQGLAKPAAMDATLNPNLGEEVGQMYNVKDPNGRIVGVHSSTRGFIPSRPELGLKPGKTIPNGHTIDTSSPVTPVKSRPAPRRPAGDEYRSSRVREEVEQIDEKTHLEYTGKVNDNDYRLLVPHNKELGDYSDVQLHRKLSRENPHLSHHEVTAIVHSYGNHETDVDVEHKGEKYTHHVVNDQEPNYIREEVDDLSEEDILEAKKEMMKEMVRKHKGTMKEDVDALFNGESLSEDFRVKATLIFESAVTSRVESILEGVLADNDELLSEAVSEIKTEMSEQVDAYLNYVVEEWMTENAIAIESGLRAELTEDFINGLKNLFVEHYVEIPDEKLDVAEELAARVVELEEAAEAAAAETAALSEELNAVKKDEAIRKVCEGLTEVQIGKMKSLAESVEFTTEGDFDHKLAVIRENYFPSKVQVKSEVKAIQEAAADEAPEVVQASGIMAHYVNSLTKTAPKA
jgi:hypothetical protein